MEGGVYIKPFKRERQCSLIYLYHFNQPVRLNNWDKLMKSHQQGNCEQLQASKTKYNP